jgi:hypothetical protein
MVLQERGTYDYSHLFFLFLGLLLVLLRYLASAAEGISLYYLLSIMYYLCIIMQMTMADDGSGRRGAADDGYS